MEEIPIGKINATYNLDEARVSNEVYDLYCFLHSRSTMSPNRRKDVLRASVESTPFGYIFGGLISLGSAKLIDERLDLNPREDPCIGLQRDHFYTWKDTAEYLFSNTLLNQTDFWLELKRRNEVVILTKTEHSRVGQLQRKGHGLASYRSAEMQLLRIDIRAIKLSGYKAALVREYWPLASARHHATLEAVLS